MQSQPGDVYIPSQFLSPQQLEERQREQQQQQQPLNGVSPPPYNPSYVPQQFVAPTPQQYHPPTNSNAVAPPPATAPITTYGGSTNATDPALFDALAETERLIIKQEVEWLEAAANNAANAVNLDALGAFGEQANKYDIFTDDGGKKFRVVETSNYFCRCCLRPNHELQLHVFLPEDTQNKVMVLDRPWKFGYCCSLTDVCQQEMKVYQGDIKPGNDPDPSKMIGYIKQPVLGGMFSPKLNVMDREGGKEIATIQAKAKCCIGGMCCNHTFFVKDPSGNYMGKIVKERPGSLAQIAKELTTDADNYTMYFPKEMDVKNKANMLAALHLIDYMFFEDEGDLNLDIRNQKCSYKCCDFYCCGCVLPCKVQCQRCGKNDKVQDSQQSNHHGNGYQQTQSNGYTHPPPPPHDHHHHHHHGHHHDHHHHHPPPPPPHHRHHHPPPHHDHHHHHHHPPPPHHHR